MRVFQTSFVFRFILAIWLCFLIRGFFYSSFFPLWEGYDEWAHFAYIERLATKNGALLVDRNTPISREVQASLLLVPRPWGAREASLTHDAYWRLSSDERARMQQQLYAIPAAWSSQPDSAGAPIYEALQAPLYYWLMSIPYSFVKQAPLLTRVFLLRYASLGIASLALPLVFLAAYRVTGNSAAALAISALLASMPELMVDVCRIGNECLGVLIYSWLVLICTGLTRDLTNDPASRRAAIWAGVALGLGLLTKAYFLTAVPAVAVVYLWRIWNAKKRRTTAVDAAITFGIALGIAGWWYIRNRLTTGTWTGLLESVILRHYSWHEYLAGVSRVAWGRAVDTIVLSHVWFGGWSGLQLRGWMYRILSWIAALGILGIGVALWRSKRRQYLYPLLAIYGFFWIGQLYNVLLLFLSKGVATSMGWYMYAVISAEVILLAVGLQSLVPTRAKSWVLFFVTLSFVAIDLYSVQILSIPYYTGLTFHRPNGAPAALHLSQLGQVGIPEVVARLAANKPVWLAPGMLVCSWIVYICATLLLIGLAFWIALNKNSQLPNDTVPLYSASAAGRARSKSSAKSRVL